MASPPVAGCAFNHEPTCMLGHVPKKYDSWTYAPESFRLHGPWYSTALISQGALWRLLPCGHWRLASSWQSYEKCPCSTLWHAPLLC